MKITASMLVILTVTAFYAGCMEKSAVKSEPVKKSAIGEKMMESSGDTISASGLKWERAVKDLDWNKADEYCKSIGKRLPTKDELAAGFNSKVMDLRKPQYGYWSSTQDTNDPGAAWMVGFEDGKADNVVKTTSGYVRCVSSK
jgi:hypothetical protein